MSQDALITIDGDYYASGNCQFDDLQAAAAVLFDASAEQFEALKTERWYTRVFDMATFSQKKNIRLAGQIQHLAQAQQILSRILVFLSQRDRQALELFGQCQASIERLAHQDVALAKRIIALENRVLLGLDALPVLEQLSDVEKQILSGLLLLLADNQASTTADQQTYANGLITLLQVEPVMGENLLGALDRVRDVETRRLMLVCCLEYLYLHSNTFEFDDKTQQVLDAFDFGGKTVKAYQDKVRMAQSLRGNAGLAGKFGVAASPLLDEDFCISFDAVEEPQSRAQPEARESLTISSVLHIPVGDERVFRNQDILIQAYVNCEGAMTFENCRIQYNVDDLPDRITLGQGARLTLLDCHVECQHIDRRNGYFLQGKGKNTVLCSGTLFEGCNHFLELSGSDHTLDIHTCVIKNPGESFINFYGYDSSVRMEQSAIEFSEIPDEYLKHYQAIFSSSVISTSAACEITNCWLQGDPQMLGEDIRIDVLNTPEARFKSCSFSQLRRPVTAAHSITECSFEDCVEVFKSGYRTEPTSILNSTFKRCNNVIEGSDIKIENTQFFECGEKIIDGAGYHIRFCEFVNTRPCNEDTIFGRASLLFRGNGDSPVSRISQCKFDGFDGEDKFLIAASFTSKFSGSKVYVEDCTFTHCRSTRESGKIIKEYDHYLGLFDRRVETKPVNISQCRGLDKINTERAQAEDAKPKEKTAGGASIGAVFGLSALAIISPIGAAGVYASRFFKDDELKTE
ncbi:hypothetical protein [Pseudomonas chlororaphis]|uniref:hypothetical protein n=2 Tax=Pseudomonas chlororaphis TaxID=587753 RepID=UPI003144F108